MQRLKPYIRNFETGCDKFVFGSYPVALTGSDLKGYVIFQIFWSSVK